MIGLGVFCRALVKAIAYKSVGGKMIETKKTVMNIPIAKIFFDYSEERAVIETIRSGWVSQGPKCAEFEQKMAAIIGVKHARAVNSGTNAIHLALLASGIQSGDGVIVPAFTCVAALYPLEYIGAQPVLVDIDIKTFGLDIAKLAEAITPRIKAIMVTHLFGLAANIETTLSLASQHGLKVIEDAALGLGASVGERQVGSFGDASCLSFHPRKMISTGEGGMVLTNSDEISARVAELRSYGASVTAWERHKGKSFGLPIYERVGYNYKLTDIQASIGLAQIKKLPDMLQRRRKIAQAYNEALSGLPWLQLPQEIPGHTHVYQSYVCLMRTKDACLEGCEAIRRRLWEHLAERGVASVQGAQAMPTIAYFRRKYGWNPKDYPASLRADMSSLALPVYPGMTPDEQNHIIQSVRSFAP